jgi:hypothetical protein
VYTFHLFFLIFTASFLIAACGSKKNDEEIYHSFYSNQINCLEGEQSLIEVLQGTSNEGVLETSKKGPCPEKMEIADQEPRDKIFECPSTSEKSNESKLKVFVYGGVVPLTKDDLIIVSKENAPSLCPKGA